MSNINSYSGGNVSGGGVSAPKMDVGKLGSYSYNPNLGGTGSNTGAANYQTSSGSSFAGIGAQISNYDGNVDKYNRALTAKEEDTLDLNTFIESDIEKGQNVLNSETRVERETTPVNTNLERGNNVLTSEHIREERTTQPIVQQTEPVTEAPKEKKWWEKGLDWLGQAGATIVVGATSVVSGVADVVEGVVDGGAYVAAGALSLVGLDDAATDVKEFIQTDWVDEANKALYEDGGLLSGVNEASAMKYDSDLAQGIRSATEGVTEFAAATALTVFTGGAGAFAFGALNSLGDAAESTYQTSGTDTTFWQDAMIVGSGALGGLSSMASGGLGKGFLEIGKTAATIGGKEVLTQLGKDIFSKEFLTKMLKEGLASKNAIGNYIASLFMTGDDLMPYLTGEKEIDGGAIAGLSLEYLKNLGLNVLEDGLRSYVTGFHVNAENAQAIAQRYLNGDDNVKLEDIFKLSPASQGEIFGSMSPEDLAKLSTEDLQRAAATLSDENFAKIIGAMNAQDISRILENMSPLDIAKKLEKASPQEYRNIMDQLSRENRLQVIFNQGQLAAQGKYRGFFCNFREHAGGHTQNVEDYAVEIGKKAGLSAEDLEYVKYGSRFHDLGMRGGLFFDKSTKTYRYVDDVNISEMTLEETVKYIKSSNGLGKISVADFDIFMQKTYGIENWSSNPSLELLPQSILDDSFSNKLANLARKNHPLNSAIAILTEDVVPDEIDKNVVALLAMSHSKSTSGIRNFNDPNEWRSCIDKLCDAMKAQGASADEVATIRADLTRIIDDDSSFKRIIDQALCIRDGDAFSALALTDDGHTIMQTGAHAILDYNGTAMMNSYNDVPTTSAAEQAGITDILYDSNGNQLGAVTDNFSKKIHAGELNLGFDSTYNGMNYSATITIKNPLQTPYATLDAAFERAGEVATYSNCGSRSFVIELPKSMEGTDLGKWYEARVKELRLEEVAKAQDEGYWTQQLEDFYKNMVTIKYS